MIDYKHAPSRVVLGSSEQAIDLDSLLSTAEVAALLGVHVNTLRKRMWRLGMASVAGPTNCRYWSRRQAEFLRGRS